MKLTFSEVKNLEWQGAHIGSCAGIYLNGIFVGTPDGDCIINPEDAGHREVFEARDGSTESVFLPTLAPNYANRLGYSDTTPYEIVKRVSARTLVIREMRADRDPSWAPEIVLGGFLGHCTNQREQRWFITSEPANGTIRIRLSAKRGWRDAGGARYQLSATPLRFYDYNF
jgi:hypothetical protein